MPQPLLSIGMIVKNEIRCIEKCLKALQPLRDAIPCELVIADTGSDDGTREVIEQYADIVFDFEWIKDFAAARNAVMDRCSGQWYLSIDADEYLKPDLDELLSHLNGPSEQWPDMMSIIQRNYTKADMSDGGKDFPAWRILNMKTGLRFQGSIHETWVHFPGIKTVILTKTVVDHDGYAFVSKEDAEKKSRRNLDLLEEELRANPDDIRRINQCIESSAPFPYELQKYARRAMEVLLAHPEKIRSMYGPSMCRNAVEVAFYYKMPEFTDWLAFAEDHLKRSAYRLDIAHFGTAHYLVKKEFSQALARCNRYENAWAAIKKMPPDQLLRETQCSSLRYDGENVQKIMQLYKCRSLAFLEDYQAAADVFLKFEPDQTQLVTRGDYLRAAGQLKELESVQKKLGQLWNEILEDTSNENSAIRGTLLKDIQVILDTPSNMQWKLLKYIQGDIGIAARMQEGENLISLMNQVSDWETLHPSSILVLIREGIVLPEQFYQCSLEKRRACITYLTKRGGVSQIQSILKWEKGHDQTSYTMVQLQFAYELLIGALRMTKWKEENIGNQLVEQWHQIGERFLRQYYSAIVLENEDNWASVAPMHHYMLEYLKGYQRLVQGDELGWTSSLRKALQIAPSMKRMVEFLMEHPPETPRSRELKELAQKVKALLSQYPEDDPAVLAIKQSPIYQKVAHLLEKPRKIMPEPMYEEPTPELTSQFHELMDGCTFKDQEEAEQQIQASFDRISHANQVILTNYWKTFPLWGKDNHEVYSNIATAFYKNREKFQWMYDHLQDNQSRKVLISVLNRWRYFKPEVDGSIKETRYDDYFDRELVFCDEDEVFVDLGGYIGDTFLSYIKNYGPCKCYYCYEISKENFEKISKLVQEHSELDCRLKGAGDKADVMYLHTGNHDSANHLEKSGLETVEVVAIDEDITEPITFLKMDIEGAEQSALRGCEQHIKEDKPKLALSVYHNFEDIWKLAYMVEEWVPGYHFYLRYHGGSGWPSEITLIGLPPQ